MKHTILILTLLLSVLGQIQSQTMEKLTVKGTLIYTFIQDPRMNDHYCQLKTHIIIDNEKFDFLSSDNINHEIARNNSELAKSFDVDSFEHDDFFAYMCIAQKGNLNKNDCDSALNQYSTHNIYDDLLYKLETQEFLVSSIKSNSIYVNENSDSVFIVLKFKGSVIKYNNVIYGAQSDPRYYEWDNGMTEFDYSHSHCPFEKYDKTFMVLHRVKYFKKISKLQAKKMGLKKTNIQKITIFHYI